MVDQRWTLFTTKQARLCISNRARCNLWGVNIHTNVTRHGRRLTYRQPQVCPELDKLAR